MAAEELPNRSNFIEHLVYYDGRSPIADGEHQCAFCNRDLAARHPSNPGYQHRCQISRAGTETAVILHGEHVVGVHCVMDWFRTNNTCPTCGTIIFQEVTSDVDDKINLQRLSSLQNAAMDCQRVGDYVTKEIFDKMWRSVVDDRAMRFQMGDLPITVADYGVYVHRKPRMTAFPSDARTVDARPLVARLEALWKHAFCVAAERPAVRWTQERKLMVPCHPLAVVLLQRMTKTLNEFDGISIPATYLEAVLTQDFVNSALWKRLNHLAQQQACPHGFHIYQSQLKDAVMRWFVQSGQGREPAAVATHRFNNGLPTRPKAISGAGFVMTSV